MANRYEIVGNMSLADIPWLEDHTIRGILRNVLNILQTKKGTCPLYRDFGVDTSFVDKPVNSVPPLIRAVIREAIEEYEPRVRVDTIDFIQDTQNIGKITVKVGLIILGL